MQKMPPPNSSAGDSPPREGSVNGEQSPGWMDLTTTKFSQVTINDLPRHSSQIWEVDGPIHRTMGSSGESVKISSVLPRASDRDSARYSGFVPRGGAIEGLQLVVMMDPHNIMFSQASISRFFTPRSAHARNADVYGLYWALPDLSLHGTLQQLRDGSLTVDNIYRIRVCNHDGKWYTLDNRRLWVFREYGEVIAVNIVERSKEFFQKLTRENDGDTIFFHDRRIKKKQSFLSIVLRWSVEDLMNERMYVNKVRPIPITFEDPQTYYRAFQLLSLENTRAEVQHSLEGVGSAPYVSLGFVEHLKNSCTNESQLRKFKLTASTVGRISVQRNNEESPWKPKPNDLVVLTTLVPERLQDLQRSGEHYTLAEIQSLEYPESMPDDSPLSFTVIAYAHGESPEYKEFLEGKRTWCAVFLANLATGKSTWEALNRDLLLIKDDLKFVEETLHSPRSCTTSAGKHQLEDGIESLVENYCKFYRHLNVSQTEAAKCMGMGILKKEDFRVRLIQGSAGTGKTITTAALVSFVSCLKARVLVCAPTKRAVAEVAGRFLKEFRSSMSDFLGVTSPASIGIRFSQPLQMGDVVMVGNQDGLDIDGVLRKIFLPHRTERLLKALGDSGWRHAARLVVNFLKNAPAEFELWKVNRAKEAPELDYLQFVGNKLKLMGNGMIRNGDILCSDLSSKWLNPDARKSIENLCNALRKLLKVLDNNGAKERYKLCTSYQDLFSANWELLHEQVSSQTGHFLDRLNGAPPTVEQIEELCIKDACVVFSTVASAGQPCVIKSGSFGYVIIDDAAQLAEAETAIVTQVPGIKQTLLVSDLQQLQVSVTSQAAIQCGYGRSLFERLHLIGHPCHTLNLQYRMHPAISRFPSQQFYNGGVNHGPNVLSRSHKKPYQDLHGPYAFIVVRNGKKEMEENSTSWNPVEFEVIQHLITKIRAETFQNVAVGVISPYKGKVNFMMEQQLNSSNITHPGAFGQVQVDVKTVDGFQGAEKDVILLSAVLANAGGHRRLTGESGSLTVALTRGRYCVWIIGNASTLTHDEKWRALVKDAQERHCYWESIRDDQGLRIIRV